MIIARGERIDVGLIWMWGVHGMRTARSAC